MFCLSCFMIIIIIIIVKVNGLDWYMLGNLTYNFGDEFLNGCIIIMKPTNVSIDEAAGLKYLAGNLATANSSRLSDQIQVGMYTYEVIMQEASDIMGIRSCYNSLHVVILNQHTDSQLITFFNNNIINRSCWLLYAESMDYIQTLELMKFNIDAKIFVALKLTNEFIDINEVYRVAENFPIRNKKVGSWNISTLHIKTEPIYKNRGDLEMFRFRAGSLENWPISSFFNGEAGKTMDIDGMFPRVWFELGNIMNFSTSCFESVDRTSGKLQSNGTWTGLVGMLLRNEIDVILSEFSMSSQRLSVAEPLLPLLKANLEIYYVAEGIPWDWMAMFQPFETQIWIALSVWLFVAALSLRISTTLAISHGLQVAQYEMPSPMQNTFFVFQSICQQGAPHTPKVWATRIIFITCYLASAVLVPCYSASLISSLAGKDSRLPFDSIQDLVTAKFPIYVGDMYELEFFESSKDKWISRAYKELVKTVSSPSEIENYAIAYEKMCREPVALFGADSVIEERMKSTLTCNPVTFSKPMLEIYQVIGLKKGSQFREIINCNILRMNEYGLTNRFKVKFRLKYEEEIVPLVFVDLDDVVEIFMMLIFTMVLSTIFLLAEISFCRYFKGRKSLKP